MIRIWNIFKGRLPWAGSGAPHDQLHSTERMRAILDRERMRADRGNASFALLTFTIHRSAEAGDLATLAGILSDRIRATDDAGLLGARRVGVVLPETPAEGAWKLSQDVCDLLPQRMRRPDREVYVYPSLDDAADPTAEVEEDETPQGRPARSMHVLFAQPLPAWKRAIDVIGAFTALVLLSPLLLIVAVAIKLTSPGPVIFRQGRDTIAGRRFTMYKFRTMVPDAERAKAALRQFSEQDGPAFKMTNDPRITRLGKFLRATSIDELPQLFNVLLGDMSLVGPRPLPCDESGDCEVWQRRRLDVTPGITCIWQVHGRSTVSFSEWIRMDLRYVESRSLANDLWLLVQTIPAVALRRGAR
ncbi:MAG: sugar transferase [Pirellulales bacterium]